MGNCLVTKLNGEVSNPSLLRIGVVRIHQYTTSVSGNTYSGNATIRLWSQYFGPVPVANYSKVKLVNNSGNCVLYDQNGVASGSEINSAGFEFSVSPGECDIDIEVKYDLNSLILLNLEDRFKIKEDSMEYFGVNATKVVCPALENTDVYKSIFANKTDISLIYTGGRINECPLGEVAKVAKDVGVSDKVTIIQTFVINCNATLMQIAQGFPKLKYLFLVYPGGISGNFGDLGSLTEITSISIQRSYSDVAGSIEEFVTTQRNSGRTSASSIQLLLDDRTNVTYQGNILSGTYSLSWDNNGVITLTSA